MAVSRGLVRAITVLGPLIARYGPQVIRWLRENPELLSRVTGWFRQRSRATEITPDAMRRTLETMREQVDYLRESADDSGERARALTWSESVTSLEHAVAMLDADGPVAERTRVRDRIDQLRQEILDAFLAEQIEDAGGPAPIERGDDTR